MSPVPGIQIVEGGTKWEAVEKREEERGREGTYDPSLRTTPTPSIQCFFLVKISSRCPQYLTAWNRLLKMSFKAPGDEQNQDVNYKPTAYLWVCYTFNR